MDNPWNFHCFLTERNEPIIKKWEAQLSKIAEAKLDRTIEHLRVQPETEWRRPHAAFIVNHIYVIHFTDENRKQWRLFGHFYEPHHVFVTTLGGFEKDDTYDPSNFVDICKDRKLLADKNFSDRTVKYLSLPCLGCEAPSEPKVFQPTWQIPEVE